MLRLILICLTGYLALCAAVFVFQRKLQYAPATSKPDRAEAGLPALQEAHVLTAAGLRLPAWYLPGAPGKPVLAYFHGNGGNLENRVPRFRRAAAVGSMTLHRHRSGYGSHQEAGTRT
jgi:hypothetical protein